MAIRINKVYTRTGDDGHTGVVGGSRIAKSSPRIAAYGDVDELNSVLGVVRAELAGQFESPRIDTPPSHREAAEALDGVLAFLQQELFDLGGELATPPDAEYEGMRHIGAEHVERLEGFIDDLQPDLSELKSFILPGGGKAGALLHLARTVCRRAERLVTELVENDETSAWTARYLNRLSDLLFVQARWIAARTGHDEALWQHGLEAPGRRRSEKS